MTKRLKTVLISSLSTALIFGCQAPQNVFNRQSTPPTAPLQFFQAGVKGLPDLYPIPAPANNPITQGKVELGFRLWFEPLLSANNKMSCATCHDFRKGFSNSQPNAVGVTGARGNRNVPTIYAAAYQHETFWDGRAASLEEQALGPIQNPVEMNETLENVLRKLNNHPYYRAKFQEVFQSPPNAEGMAKALASFERALVVKPTAYERYQAGDENALNGAQKRGMLLFMRRNTECFNCHRGPDFSDHNFNNIGVGMDQSNPDLGRFNLTRDPLDHGAFKTPTLINISRSGPYMHNGSLKTLREVVDFYDRGGTPNANLDPRIRPLNLSEENKNDLVAFLESLSAPDNLQELSQLPGIHLSDSELREIFR